MHFSADTIRTTFVGHARNRNERLEGLCQKNRCKLHRFWHNQTEKRLLLNRSFIQCGEPSLLALQMLASFSRAIEMFIASRRVNSPRYWASTNHIFRN